MVLEDGAFSSMISTPAAGEKNRYEVPREQKPVKKIDCVRDLGVLWSLLCWAILAGVALMIFFFVFDKDNGGGGGGGGGDKQRLFSQLFSPYLNYDGPAAVTGSVEVVSVKGATTVSYELEGVDPRCSSVGVLLGSCGVHVHPEATCDAVVGPRENWPSAPYTSSEENAQGSFTVFDDDTLLLGDAVVIVYDYEGEGATCSLLGPEPPATDAPSIAPTRSPTLAPTTRPPTAATPSPTTLLRPTLSPSASSDEPTSSPAALSIVERHGRLVVEDGFITGERSGSRVQLKGMSLFWSNTGWGGGKYYNKEAVAEAAQVWGANVIRAAIGVDESGGYLEDPEGNRARASIVIEAAIAEGIYVILDWHTHHAEDYEQVAKVFFGDFAKMYGKKENLIFEVYNEPILTEWPIIRKYAENVLDVIRKQSPNLVLVGTPKWSQDVDLVDPLIDANTAYVLHFYAATHSWELRIKAQDALDAGLALFVSEWGSVEAAGNGEADAESTQEWFDWMDARSISSCNWALNDKDESASALKPGASVNGGWTSQDMTDSGLLVRAYLVPPDPPPAATLPPSVEPGSPTPSPSYRPTHSPTELACCSWSECLTCGDTSDWCAATASNCEGDCDGLWCADGAIKRP